MTRALRQFARERRVRWSSLLTAASLVSCTLSSASPTPSVPQSATQTESWQTLAPGLEFRLYRPSGNYPFTVLTTLRIDPGRFAFRAHYQPGTALSVQEWRTLLPDAVAFVNANFFDRANSILGLLVSDGIAYGQVYNDRGGLVQVQNGMVRVRSTLIEPYFGEPLEQAVQAFPMLVTNGISSFSNTRGDRVSRRTVAGQDSQGHIMLMVTSSIAGMTLTDLSMFLEDSDLDLVNAVNLDGGGSTLMALDVPNYDPYRVFSFDSVPAVLAVYLREDIG